MDAQPVDFDTLQQATARLKYQLWQFRRAEHVDVSAAAAQLAGLEREFFALVRSAESEYSPHGSAVLAELHRLRDECRRRGNEESAAAIDRVVRAFLEDSIERWRTRQLRDAAGRDAEQLFDALLETSALQLKSDLLSPEAPVAGEAFDQARHALRKALKESLATHPATPEQRARWATALSDQADLLLTSLDHAAPPQAVARLDVVADDLRWHVRHVERRFRGTRRRLRSKLRRVRAEQQERLLRSRLDRRFGARFVDGTERLILVLIVLVVGLLGIEAIWDLPQQTLHWFNIIDASACGVFLSEFFVRLWHVRGKWLWFRRHFFVDFLPSIPFGFVLGWIPGAYRADIVRLGRLARLLRLPLVRGFGLLARGLDGLARQYGHVLNQNVILYPTREELARARQTLFASRSDLRRLDVEFDHAWDAFLEDRLPDEGPRLLAVRIDRLRDALCSADEGEAFTARAHRAQVRETPLTVLIERLATATPADVEAELGEQLVAQAAMNVRLFARAPLRWFPIIRQLVPRITDDMSDAEVAVAAAQRLARLLKRYDNVWFWFADLYGTVTPSEFLDRVGSILVKGSFRPFYRLVLFGGLFLVTQLAIAVTRLSLLNPVERFLDRFVGPTLMVLGTVCFFILALGWWLRRVAREATEFYERSVQAQFLSLTEVIRGRHLARDVEILYDRVLRPEWQPDERDDKGHRALSPERPAECFAQKGPVPFFPGERRRQHLDRLLERVKHSMVEAHVDGGDLRTVRGLENTLLLYRDWLDGGLLTDNDVRTAGQLLGNPAVRQLLSLSGRIDRKRRRGLQALDLVRQKSFGGPYLWFNFISRSVAYSVAALLIDYNQNAIPLDELPQVPADARRRYEQWLAEHDSADRAARDDEAEAAERDYVTTAFTALHVLDFDPGRDADIEARFGPQVLERLQTDRSLLIRRIFGTYPMHDRPKAERVVNLYALYNKWLAGGRALLLPVFAVWAALRFLWTVLVWIGRSVQQIRRPELRTANRDAAKAHFFTAIRKIGRIRDPIVCASLRLRILMDPEYLGVRLPGHDESTLTGADVESDLRFLDADADLVAEVEQQRQHALSEIERLEDLIDGGLLERACRGRPAPAEQSNEGPHPCRDDTSFDVDPSTGSDTPPAHTPTEREALRAAAVIYLGDIRQVRTLLSADAILNEVYHTAADSPVPPGSWLPRPLLRRTFRRYWSQYGFGEEREETAAWRATVSNVRGVRAALQIWSELGAQASAQGESVLSELLRHPGRITEQLMALRAIQTLAVLDVLNYRQHVYELGQYAEMGDMPGELLEWRTTRRGQLLPTQAPRHDPVEESQQSSRP